MVASLVDSKRMLAKEVEEEEEGQTSRGSPVIGKCLHWDLYHTSFFGVEKIVEKRPIPFKILNTLHSQLLSTT